MTSEFLRAKMILSDPRVLARLEAGARSLGVSSDEVESLLAETRQTALSAVARTTAGLAPLREMLEPGGLELAFSPPEDPGGFVPWVVFLLSFTNVHRERREETSAWPALCWEVPSE